MKLLVGSQNPVKIGAAKQALSQALNTANLVAEGVHAPSGVAAQPMTEAETRLGAVNRVKAIAAEHEADWYVAIEGGVDLFEDGPATFAYVVIFDGEQWSVGRSVNLPLPMVVYQRLVEGEELGYVMDDLFDTQNVKQKGGAIGLLTNQLATRQSVYEVATLLAMTPFNHPQLYAKK